MEAGPKSPEIRCRTLVPMLDSLTLVLMFIESSPKSMEAEPGTLVLILGSSTLRLGSNKARPRSTEARPGTFSACAWINGHELGLDGAELKCRGSVHGHRGHGLVSMDISAALTNPSLGVENSSVSTGVLGLISVDSGVVSMEPSLGIKDMGKGSKVPSMALMDLSVGTKVLGPALKNLGSIVGDLSKGTADLYGPRLGLYELKCHLDGPSLYRPSSSIGTEVMGLAFVDSSLGSQDSGTGIGI